jgi:hypothetical protein
MKRRTTNAKEQEGKAFWLRLAEGWGKLAREADRQRAMNRQGRGIDQ